MTAMKQVIEEIKSAENNLLMLIIKLYASIINLL